MGLSFETLIAWHRALGNLFLALIMVHVACWYRHCNPLMYPSFSTDISVRSVGMAWEPTGYFGGGHLTAHPHRQHKTLTQTLIEHQPNIGRPDSAGDVGVGSDLRFGGSARPRARPSTRV